MRAVEYLLDVLLLLLLSIVDNNVSDAYSGLQSGAARVPGLLSWLEGHRHCRDNGLSLPSLATAAKHYNIRRPEWTGGLVVTKSYYDGQQTIQIAPRKAEKTAVQCCVPQNSSICKEVHGEMVLNFTASYRSCRDRNMSLSTIVGDSSHMNFRFGNARGFWFWAEHVNVTSFFNDDNITVLCLVNDGSGTVKTDSCDKKHWVVCVNDYQMPVFYLPQMNETAYKPLDYHSSLNPGTSAHPSDSNSLPTEGKGFPGWSFPIDLVYILAGAGVALLLTVVLVVVCCCCRRRRVQGRDGGDVTCDDESCDVNSVYAVPDDDVQRSKAKPRTSVTEQEYDVLGITDTPDRPNTGNVYSHIPIGTNKKKLTKTAHVDSDSETYDAVVFNRTLSKGVGDSLYEQIDKSPT